VTTSEFGAFLQPIRLFPIGLRASIADDASEQEAQPRSKFKTGKK
jgi:hypothetical protein